MYRQALLFSLLALWCESSMAAMDYCDSNPSGVSLETDKQRLTAIARVPVEYNDNSGRRKAAIVGEERAKGNLIRWFEQTQYTSRSAGGGDADASSLVHLTNEDGSTTTSSVTREQSLILEELDSSFAVMKLNAVNIVQEKFYAEKMEMCVVVGISRKSGLARKEAEGWMKGQDSGAGTTNSGVYEAADDGTSSYERTIDEDW